MNHFSQGYHFSTAILQLGKPYCKLVQAEIKGDSLNITYYDSFS